MGREKKTNEENESRTKYILMLTNYVAMLYGI